MDARAEGAPVSQDQGGGREFGRSGIEFSQLREALVRRLIGRRLPRDQAEDAIQDAFVRLCLVDRRQRVRNPAAFLTSVLTRIRIDHWRWRQRYYQQFLASPAEMIAVADLSPDPSDYVQAEQRLKKVRRRLETVRPLTRDVFVMHRVEGRTYAQIASAFGISVSAVEKHIARAAMAIAEFAKDD
jgi:RNA polymerase sigma factor (sigma-70 family)